MRFNILATFILTALSLCDLSAQFYTLSGNIYDDADNPLEGASVFIRESDHATITDSRGRFVLDSLEAGVNVLVCTHIGHKRILEYLELTGDLDLEIAMEKFSYDLDAVMITSNRIKEDKPFSFSTVRKEEMEPNNLGQDLPFLLRYSPSLVVSSDAGAGIGYTGLRIRGSDPTRINVNINGIPINDAESQSVFWVNMPDFASSAEDIQIQRGVGTSTSGTGSFGGTIGINTHKIRRDNYIDVTAGVGSFGTNKISAKLGTGLLNNTFFIDGRVSFINSDGFIDRASSDLSSYYISVGKITDNSTLRFDYFSGQEETFQAWNGVPKAKFDNDQARLQNHFDLNFYPELQNPILVNTDAQNIYSTVMVKDSTNLFESDPSKYNYYTFENEIDRYQQDHYQLHWGTSRDDYFESNVSLHYTRGEGYFEQFKLGESLADYGLSSITDTLSGNEVTEANLVRRKWLKNHFYGAVANLKWNFTEQLNLHWGSAVHIYTGNHLGRIHAWDIRSAIDPTETYYNNDGDKTEASSFLKLNYELKKISFFGDLQYRYVSYGVVGRDDDLVVHDFKDNLNFINPKAGVSYMVNDENQLYASVSVGNREPDRNDYLSVPEGEFPKSERMIDYELGLRSRYEKLAIGLNLYYMDYKDQLVITGELNDVGATLRANVPESYRSGIEAEIGFELVEKVDVYANATFSQNKIAFFEEILFDYGTNSEVINTYEDTDIVLSPNVISAFGLNYRPMKGLQLGVQSKYVGPQFLDNTSNPDRALDAYFLTGLTASYKMKWKKIKNIQFNAQVNNLFNAKYASNGYSFSYLYEGVTTTENYVFPQAGLNWLLGLTIGI